MGKKREQITIGGIVSEMRHSLFFVSRNTTIMILRTVFFVSCWAKQLVAKELRSGWWRKNWVKFGFVW